MGATMARWDEEALYLQFLHRDSSQDGKFLTGVLTTGIYCLPSCPARRPKRENVRFFHSPDEARKSGLRPCFRCRPDSLYRGEEFHETLCEQTMARVRANPGEFRGIADMARTSGLSRTALNNLFHEHAHESPGCFLRHARTDSACQLIENGVKPGDAAAQAGFESTSSFHEQLLVRTGMTPAAYAALRSSQLFTLQLPAHYRQREVLDFFGRDNAGVSERVRPDGFSKCFEAVGRVIEVEVTFAERKAICRTNSECSYLAHRGVQRMLGLGSDAGAFERQFSDDDLLGKLLMRQKGLRIPLTPEPWEALAWAIMGQQISLQAAVALRRGLINAKGRGASGIHGTGLRAFPSAEAVAEMDVDFLRRMKFPASKAEYLLAAARAVTTGEVPLAHCRALSTRHLGRLLSRVRGVGPWTVQYVFLRGAGFADCLPAGDAGLARGLGTLTGRRPDESGVKELLSRYSPFRSLASCHVWASLKDEPAD
jgi:AraC family transcriptional regulator of adaptative response / DNA-3-methyladenine glycosylase II